MQLFRYCTVVLLLFSSISDSAIINVQKKMCRTCGWMKHVFDYIVVHLQPPQVTIFTPDWASDEFYQANHIQKRIISNISTLLVNTRMCDEKHPIFKLSVFKDPRRANFYVVLFHSDNFAEGGSRGGAEELEGILTLMANIAPRPTRPRCLLILFGTKAMDVEVIESISLYAWSKKFLEFTILMAHQNVNLALLNEGWIRNDVVTYHYYNPFLKKHFSGFYEEKTELFPDKLYNFHGYTFVVSATNNPPYVILERNETGYPILSRKGSNYRTLRILSRKLNFKYEFAPSSYEDYSEGHNSSYFNRLLNGEINFSINHLFIRKIAEHFTTGLERSIITTAEEYSALVPVSINNQVKLPEEFESYMLVGIVMIIIFYLLIYILKFDKDYWSGTRIMEILFNSAVFSQPKVWSERLVFFCITFMAFNFSVTFITIMTQIQFLPQEIQSHDLSTMGKLDYRPVILEQFRDLTLEDEIEENASFKSRLQVFKSPEHCSNRLEKGEKIICFMTKVLAERLIKHAKERNVELKMALIKPSLWTSWKCMMFERGSPVIKGINRVLQRLRDSGLLNRFVYDVTYHGDVNTRPTEAEILSKTVISPHQLMVQLITGYIIAFIVLGLELITYRLKKTINKFGKRLKISHLDRILSIARRWN